MFVLYQGNDKLGENIEKDFGKNKDISIGGDRQNYWKDMMDEKIQVKVRVHALKWQVCKKGEEEFLKWVFLTEFTY